MTKIAFAELYNALKQGVVDGQENPLAVIYYKKLYEVQKHLSLTKHVYNNMIHVMSKKIWDKLTPEQQNIVKEGKRILHSKAEYVWRQVWQSYYQCNFIL